MFFTASEKRVVRGVVFARAGNERVIFEVFRILRRVVLLQVIGRGEQKVVVERRRPSEKSFGGRFVGKVGNVDAPCQHVLVIALVHQVKFDLRIDLLVVLQLPDERVASDV